MDDSERLVFNIGGTRHETHIGTLKTVHGTRLAWIAENHTMLMHSSFYDKVKQEYFFDRHPTCFASILQYYRTGKLHYPPDVCGPLFNEELLFWGIDETQMEDCCWESYTAHKDKLEKLVGFKGPHFESDEDERAFGNTKMEKIRSCIWSFLDDPYSSKAAKVSGRITTLMLALYVLAPVLFSMKNFKNLDTPERSAAVVLEIFTNAYFTLEFILRVWSCPDKKHFIRSKMNWIDFLSLWSFYMELSFTSSEARRYIGLLAIFRIVKIFRTFRYNYALQVLVNTLKESLPELMLLVFLLTILALGFAFLNYHLEDDIFFYNIPNSLWWSLITMTTVGYGDMAPVSWAGKFVGIACAICGLLMVALPVSVVATNFSVYYSYAKARIKLPPKKKVKPGMFSNALNLVQTEESVSKTDKKKDNKVGPSNGVEVPAHHANGTLPPVRTGPGGQEMTNRWYDAVEKMKEKGMIKKRLNIAQLVSVFGSKGTWPGAGGR